MEKSINAVAEAAAAIHLGEFVESIADAVNKFVDVFDPSMSEELMAYTRRVLEAADAVVLTACMAEDNEEAREQMRKSNDIKIQQLIDKANKDAETH